jgi:hypothetical protein
MGVRESAREQDFTLTIEPDDGRPAFVVGGQIDRIDWLPSGGIEAVDYKTGRMSSQKDVAESLQLSIYALACRDALGLGTPEQVTLGSRSQRRGCRQRARTSSSISCVRTWWPGWHGYDQVTSPRTRRPASAGDATTRPCARPEQGEMEGLPFRRTEHNQHHDGARRSYGLGGG